MGQTALNIPVPNEKFKAIQSMDRNLANSLVYADAHEVIATIGYWESKRTKAGAGTNYVEIDQEIASLEAILRTRRKLSTELLGIQEATLIPMPNNDLDEDLKNQPIEERQDIAENKTFDATQAFIEKAKEEEEIKNKSDWKFKGYTRKKIYGTPIELPVDVQVLIVGCDTEGKIDEITSLLMDEKRYEDALNLSIDLFANLKKGELSQEQVEKRFLFDILPYYKGVTCVPFEDMENISLALWIKHLDDLANNKKLFEELKNQVIEEVKAGEISVELANKVFTSNLLEGKESLYDAVKEELNLESLVFATEPNKPTIEEIIENQFEESKEEKTVEGLTFETLEKECLEMLKIKKSGKVRKHFEKSLKLVVDKTTDEKKKINELWAAIQDKAGAKIIIKSEENSESIEITPEEKEEIIAKAEKAAIEGKEELTSEPQIRERVKSLIMEKGKKALNDIGNILRANKIKNLLPDKYKKEKNPVVSYYKDVLKEVEDKGELPTPQFKLILDKVDLSKENPDVAESASKCANIDELRSLVLSINYDMKDKLDNPARVAYNVVLDYMSKFNPEWSDEQKTIWYKDVLKSKIEAKKENEKKEVEATIKEKGINESPFAAIAKVDNAARGNDVKKLSFEALKAGIDEEELNSLIRLSAPYKGSTKDDVKNVIKKLKRQMEEPAKA